jgi:hypothetical protein
MKCEFCSNEFSNKNTLNSHQKTAKYCLVLRNVEATLYNCEHCKKGFTKLFHLQRHQESCKTIETKALLNLKFIEQENIDLKKKLQDTQLEYEKKLSLKDKIIKKIRLETTQKILEKDKDLQEHKSVIKELQAEYKRQMEMQNKDLQDRMQSMAEKAIAKPSSFNQNTTQIINNLLPITTEHLDEQVQYLTIDHVKNGAVGYAKYALEHPLKDRLVCTDTSRKKGKYKDSDGNIVSDPEMSSITKKLFFAINERNGRLVTEYANDLKAKMDSFNSSSNNEITEEEACINTGITDDLIDLITAAFSQKRQSNEISDGLKPDLFHQFVKELATGSYRSN